MIKLPNQPTVLDITRVNDTQYRFIILEPGQPYFGPMQQVFDIKVNPAILNGLGKMIVDSAQKSNTEGEIPADSFKNCGELLYEQLFPARGGAQSLVETLSGLETPLLICTDDPKIFWELAHDGSNFLGLKYITGRRLKKSAVPAAIPKKEEHWRCLLISNPTLDLPNTEQETLKLSETLKRKGVTCDHLCGSEANLTNTIIHLKREYDIIHYAGHIGFDESVGEYVFYLADRETLWASNIRNQLKGSPLVFLNGCWSAADVKSHTDALHSVESLTDAFLEAGAQLVIGSLFEVPDEGARVFAEIFYDKVLKGEMVGEALRQARLQTIESKKYGAAWACFVMYGDPCLQIEFKKDETEALLNSIELTRRDFEISTLRIFEQAKEYGRPNGGISSTHLFVAMISEKDSELGNILKLQEIPSEHLKEGFQSLFKLVNDAVDEEDLDEEIVLSENVASILKRAKEITINDEREKISATDLTNAFISTGGGSTGYLLKKLGVELGSRDKDLRKEKTTTDTFGPDEHQPVDSNQFPTGATRNIAVQSKPEKSFMKGEESLPMNDPMFEKDEITTAPIESPKEPYNMINIKWPRPEPPDDILKKPECRTAAWEILICATEAALKTHSHLLSTPHLFIGLLSSPCFLLYKTLRQQGFSPTGLLRLLDEQLEKGTQTAQYEATGPPVYSQNIGKIFLAAKQFAQNANRSRVDENDLLIGFIQCGGGSTGELLARLGIELSVVFYDIFSSEGRLEQEKFEDTCLMVLGKAEEYANRLGDGFISSLHLFYGLCFLPDAKLKTNIFDRGITLDIVNGAIRKVFSSSEGNPSVELALPHMTLGAKHTFMVASNICQKQQVPKISEDHLLQALLTPRHGSVRRVLQELGITPETLVSIKDGRNF